MTLKKKKKEKKIFQEKEGQVPKVLPQIDVNKNAYLPEPVDGIHSSKKRKE